RPDEAGDAGSDGDREPVERRDGGEAFGQPLDGEDVHVPDPTGRVAPNRRTRGRMGVIPESGSGARPGWGRGSGPAQHQALYGVVAALVHDQVGTAAGGRAVLAVLAVVDVALGVVGELRRVFVGHVGDVRDVGRGDFEGGAA